MASERAMMAYDAMVREETEALFCKIVAREDEVCLTGLCAVHGFPIPARRWVHSGQGVYFGAREATR